MFHKYRVFKAMFFIAALASISGTVLLLNIAATQSTKLIPASFFAFMCLLCALFWMLKMIHTPTYVHPRDWPIDFKAKANIILQLLNSSRSGNEGFDTVCYKMLLDHCEKGFAQTAALFLTDTNAQCVSIIVNNVFLVGSAFNERALVEYTFEIKEDGKVETINQTWVYLRQVDMKVKNPNLQREPEPMGAPWVLQRICF